MALEWVKGEIAHTLKQARAALETYALQPAAAPPTRKKQKR